MDERIKLYDEIRGMFVKHMHAVSTMFFTAVTSDGRQLFIPGDELLEALDRAGFDIVKRTQSAEDSAYLNKYLSIGNQQEDEDGSNG